MTTQDFGRMALGAVVGGLAAVAITKAGLTPQSATLRWIAYCVVSGLLINTQVGMRLKYLLLAAFISALGLVVAVLWMVLLGQGAIPALSGIPLDLMLRPRFASAVLAGLLIISILGVTIGAMARPATLDVVQKLSEIDVEKAKKIESFLKVLVSITGTAALFLL